MFPFMILSLNAIYQNQAIWQFVINICIVGIYTISFVAFVCGLNWALGDLLSDWLKSIWKKFNPIKSEP
jgi:hypothetical protein